jgi:predicted DNA-binding transcriptional regulator AlpA
LRRYELFISHAWDYKGDYEGVVNLLNTHPLFLWNNLSVPKDEPLSLLRLLPKSYRFLVRQLDDRIPRADCVLVLAGMYVAHRGWIQSEIEAAKDFHKPIVAIEPRGGERFPEAVMRAADERVGWNGSSIIEAIRRCAGARVDRILPPLR